MGESESFQQISSRLDYLTKWYELAIRPKAEDCHEEDKEMFLNSNDDINELRKKCLDVRNILNQNLPPHELVLDDVLLVKDSTIRNAGYGLFYQPPIQPQIQPSPSSSSPSSNPEHIIQSGTIICYYTGHRHNFLSQKYIKDKSYLMNVSSDILVDPGPMVSIKSRYINDPLNETYINCQFVPDPNPKHYRCAVVSIRDIVIGEELFISYGDMYWSQQDYDGTIFIS